MAKVSENTSKPGSKRRPALDPENRMMQMVSMALDMVEEQLENRTASSQVLSHFLKYGTEKAKLEAEKIKYENELLKAKTELTKSQKTSEEMFTKAVEAMRKYSGNGSSEDYEH